MVKRRPRCVPLAMVWAALKILWAVPMSFLGFYVNAAQIQALNELAEAGGTGPGAVPGFTMMMRGAGVMGIIGGLVFAWALPVFLIVWLRVPRVQNEVSRWR